MKRTTAVFLVMLMIMGSFMVLFQYQNDEADALPGRAVYRYFNGIIYGLNESNPDGRPSDFGLNVTGIMANGTMIGPFEAVINVTSGNFSVRVDVESHDTSQPWTFQLTDCYGWEEAGGGVVQVPNPSDWSPENVVNHTANGTLFYKKGTFGNLSFTVYNGSSGLPLEGVGFEFTYHPLHRSTTTGNYTDANGNVTFSNMQIGLDPGNLVMMRLIKGNFTYNDGNGTGIAYRPLVQGATSHYNLTINENPLVNSYSPPDGSTGITTSRIELPTVLFVQFRGPMDQSSIGVDTLFLREVGGQKVNISYQWPLSSLCRIQPDQDLKFNTTYEVFVSPRVKNETGSEPLWRSFSYRFTTELPNAVLRCHVYINGTTDPAPEGTMLRLQGRLPVYVDDGFYEFEDVPEGTHSIKVLGPTVGGVSEYLYYGNMVDDITVERGDVLEVPGLTVTKRPTRNATIRAQDEEGNPLMGVNITHQVTMESGLTDITGEVIFQEILAERDTGFRATLENYFPQTLTVPKGTGDAHVNVTLYEKDLPVLVKARSDFTMDLPGPDVPVDAVIQVDFKDPDGFALGMDPETINTDNLKIFDPEDAAVPLDIVTTPSDPSRYTLEPRDYLDYGTTYTLFISEQVASATGTNPLWRDFTLDFSTETLDPATIVGRVTLREKGVEGVKIDVLHHDSVIGTTETGYNGNYQISIEMNKFELFNVTVRANGNDLGLGTEVFGPISIIAGGSRNGSDITLSRLDDWFQVFYPVDSEGRMPVDGTITLTFRNALAHPDMDTFRRNFSLTSPSVDLNISLSEDSRSVFIKPLEPLDHDKFYTLSVSDFPEGEFYREMRDVNGTPALIRGEKIEIRTEFKPIEVILQTPSSGILSSVPVNIPVSLFFTNYSVDTELVEGALEFVEVDTGAPVEGITYTWSNQDRNLEIDHDRLNGSTEYMVSLPAGKYGAGDASGARIRADFIVYFTTEPVLIPTLTVDDNWPASVETGSKAVITLSNPLGKPIRVAILIEEERGTSDFIEYANVTLSAAETDKQVTLDIEDLDTGEYLCRIRVYDPTSMTLLNEYPITLKVAEETSNPASSMLWVFIVIGIIVLLVIILAVYLMIQSRNRDIEEELQEEFECPECHHLVSSEDTVCPHCGAEFEEEAYKCPKCGSMLDPDDEECPECGYDFSDQEKMELEEEDEELDDMELDEEEEEMEELEDMELEEDEVEELDDEEED